MSIRFARPVHPDEFLCEEYLVPLGMSTGALARELRVALGMLSIVRDGGMLDARLKAGAIFEIPTQNS